MTERVSIFNLRSFANYQKLRNSPHAQPEIRIVAELMLEELEEKNVCPVALQALKRNNWNI
jgi:thymidylate synthase ThyX